MKLDAAWHEWSPVVLAVMIDGMLAVSAQCGCYHHFHSSFSMPFQAFSLLGAICIPFGVFFLLWSVACFIVCILVLSSPWHFYFYMILHGLMFDYFCF